VRTENEKYQNAQKSVKDIYNTLDSIKHSITHLEDIEEINKN
jgi:hypothetical protein